MTTRFNRLLLMLQVFQVILIWIFLQIQIAKVICPPEKKIFINEPIKVGLVTWGGYVGGEYFN